MYRRALVTAVAMISLASAVACSGGEKVEGEDVGQAQQGITEVGCSYRAISSPNGATLASYSNSCLGTSQTSANNTYGYSNCTDGYIWEISAVSTGTPADRKFVGYVQPAAMPTNSGDCTSTTVTMIPYGVESVNGPYTFTSSVNAVAGTWVVPGAPFSNYCTYSGNELTFALDNWPNGADASAVVVDGVRLIGQAKKGSGKVAVTVGVRPTDGDFNASCLGLVTPPLL